MNEDYKHEIVIDRSVRLGDLHTGDLFRVINGQAVHVVAGFPFSSCAVSAAVVGQMGLSEYDTETRVERLELEHIKAVVK